jgi:amino acid adenylation domain-containing protein
MSTLTQPSAVQVPSFPTPQADRARLSGPPLYRPRPPLYSEKTAELSVELPAHLYERLSAVTNGELFLQFAALLAAVNVCLYRYTGSFTNTVGCPTMASGNGATAAGNVVPVTVEGGDQVTFRELLLGVRQTILDAYAQESYPLSRLFRLEQGGGAANRCPLFDVALEIPGLHHSMPEANHDITLTFSRKSDPPSLRAAFSPELYDRQTVKRFCRHILTALGSGLEDTSRPVSDLDILSEEEREQLSAWNETAAEYPKDKCVHELFEERAQDSPDKTALVFGNQRLTYRELNERANQVAHHLRRLRVTPDSPVAIFLNRSVEQVVAVLGILKAGAAYVPYDPSYPKERLATMSEDLRVKAVLTSERLLERLPPLRGKIVCLDRDAEAISVEDRANPVPAPGPSNLCYMIFTSGSTGRPKATAVYHRGWTNLLNWFVREFGITRDDKNLVISSISFDITQRAMAMPLISGGELHLVASDHYDPALILRTIEEEQITLLNCAPSTFYPLVETAPETSYRSLRSLRRLFLGGEAISASRLKRWAASADCGAQIANVYGAAECSDVSTFYLLHDFERYVETSVPIGKPTYNSQVYVLDEKLRRVPIGVTGEICLGGDGVGKGYVTDSFLTAEKFVENPFARTPGERLYRTGDLGRYLPDGNLEFNGRVDHQVKVRGQRVELGEIETVLRQEPKVREAVVIITLHAPGDQRLIAYVVPAQQEPGAGGNGLVDELRGALSRKFPQYMIPNEFVLLEEMPLSPNGKIDRGALPSPKPFAAAGDTDALFTPTEKVLAEFYAKLLGATNVKAGSNFFDLGGHSLLVTQMLAQVTERFDIQLLPAELYRDPTVAGIARRIDAILAKEQHPA